jgi:signal transduction histidine kinase
MNVRLHDETRDGEDVPVGVGRTAYRVVQEGLTNARRHAPGAAVDVIVFGAPASPLVREDRQQACRRRRSAI